MSLSVATRNRLYFLAAALVCLVSVRSVPEALGTIIAPAAPAWLAQWASHHYGQPRRVWHHWTLILSLAAALGAQHAAMH